MAGKGNVDEIYFPRSMSVISNEYDMIQTHLIITSKVNSTLISLRPHNVNNGFLILNNH